MKSMFRSICSAVKPKLTRLILSEHITSTENIGCRISKKQTDRLEPVKKPFRLGETGTYAGARGQAIPQSDKEGRRLWGKKKEVRMT